MFDLVSYRESQSNDDIVNQGFSYIKSINKDKDELVMQNIQAKKHMLEIEGVQLVKLRNGVIIQGADHEDWEDENFLLPEDAEGLNQEAAKVNQRQDTEEDVKSYEMNLMSMGKSVMTERLKKGRIPIQVKMVYGIGKLLSQRHHFLFSICHNHNCRANSLLSARDWDEQIYTKLQYQCSANRHYPLPHDHSVLFIEFKRHIYTETRANQARGYNH